MTRRLCTLLIVLAAGCAGGDLMRSESDGELGPATSDSTTGTSETPTTSGMSGISAGPLDTTTPDDETTSEPSSDTDGTDTGGTDDGTDTGGTDETSSSGTSNDDESSSSTGDPTLLEVDLSGWTVEQANSARTFTLPANTLVPAGGVVVIGRDASRAQFEAYWGPLGDDVVYFDANDEFPAINGDETFALRDGGATIDGPTPALQAGTTVRRDDLAEAGSWTVAGERNADPGTGHPDPGASGVFLTEASDASGSGNFVYEFVELQAWP